MLACDEDVEIANRVLAAAVASSDDHIADARRLVEKGAQSFGEGTRSTIILKGGIQVDLRVVPEESYGTIQHFVGYEEVGRRSWLYR